MPVQIHGKEYFTVAERLKKFRSDFPEASVLTEIIGNINGIVTVKATLKLPNGCVCTGHASEKIDSTMINKTSALENAETSAVGRALAMAGYIGSELCSADELVTALKQQGTLQPASEIKQPPSESPEDTTQKENPMILAIIDMIQDLQPEARLTDVVASYSRFVGKDGKERSQGNLSKLSPNWLVSTYKKVKKDWDAFQETKMQLDEPAG